MHVFNQRSVSEILQMIRTLGGMVGAQGKTESYVARLEDGLRAADRVAAALPRRPRVYFEEWDEPQISAIRWVSELISIAGGDDCFPELAAHPLGRDRILIDGDKVIERQPDIILGSWCGKKFRPERVAERKGWQEIPAVASGNLHEIKSSIILQPGPAALTDGLAELSRIIGSWSHRTAIEISPERRGFGLSIRGVVAGCLTLRSEWSTLRDTFRWSCSVFRSVSLARAQSCPSPGCRGNRERTACRNSEG